MNKVDQNKTERIKELIDVLNKAAYAYYAKDMEIMSNYEYDALYDELVLLEEETGVVLSNSPTIHVGFEAVDELPKERHEKPMLSLAKTKSREELRDWLNGKEALLSWKLDGLTIVLTYEKGTLQKAVTRGNGEIGEVITNNARVFKNIPHKIAFEGRLILRGEAVITYSDFEKVNAQIADAEAKYKNPRNLCSGSVRQLNNEITSKRNVRLFAFNLVDAIGADGVAVDFKNDRENQFLFLKEQGFDVVEYYRVNPDTIMDTIEQFATKIVDYDVPSDGLVLTLCDLAYGESLGRTAKFPRDSIAFKWADETAKTTLLEIEWSPSRTGLINPVAVFEPVQLEGTTVSRASVHNLSIMEDLELGIGDRITVYKANMIIPQIAENLTRSRKLQIPKTCPVCGKATQIRQENETKTLVCPNPECEAKKIKSFTLMVSRDALNIDGLSEATLEKFIAKGFIHSFADIFRLNRFEKEITKMEGFGEKSFQNLMAALKQARNTTLPRYLYAIGIAGIGVANAKVLCKAFQYDFEKIKSATMEELSEVDGIGEVLAEGIISYFADEKKSQNALELLEELQIEKPEQNNEEQIFAGMTFVITGNVYHYANRNEVKDVIEQKGGKVAGSVSSKTNYLINNDVTSTSGKNKKAKELGIPIISEEEFISMLEM
ncbi:MAG: NAD-dependent DNA ligase LigA [Lachnospiraceae bacterium]|nr:NAD-dependent DNA ligase LigA [Lachnospiraceae bacterium]